MYEVEKQMMDRLLETQKMAKVWKMNDERNRAHHSYEDYKEETSEAIPLTYEEWYEKFGSLIND